jgi:lipopolysaccharide transport system ATP-binding protein
MSSTVIKTENIGKLYRLGEIGSTTLNNDVSRWIARIRGKEDPFAKIGEVNDRSSKGTGDFVWAVKGVDLDIKQGDVLGILGRNGSGKSTLLKLLSKVTRPTEGVIKLKGRIASLLEIGTGFHLDLTGRDNIYLNGAVLGMTKREITSKLDEIVAFSGCERYLDTPVKRYSSGMKVRLGFAVAAHLEPEILIIDEVLAVGDAEFQRKCIGKMQDVSHNDGRTVLFVSHQMGNISQLCTSAILMEQGGILMSGDTGYVIEEYLKLNNKEVSYYVADKAKGDVYFEEVAITDNKGNRVNEVPFDDGFKICMRFKCKLSDKLPKIGMAINDRFKRKVFNSYYDFTKINSDTYEVVCDVPGKVLMPGVYNIDADLVIPHMITYDYIRSVCSVSIIDSGSEIIYHQDEMGCVFVKCAWQQQ